MDIFEIAAWVSVFSYAWKVARTIWKHVGSHVKKAMVHVLDVVIAFFTWIKRILSEDDDDSEISNIGVTGGILKCL